MSGLGGDPRLFGAVWANEARLADENEDASGARQHKAEDRDAATERVRLARSRSRRSLRQRLAGFLPRGR